MRYLVRALTQPASSPVSELSSPSPLRLAVSAAIAVFVVLIRPVFAVLVALTFAADSQVLDQDDACNGDQHRRHKHENDVPDAHHGRKPGALPPDYTVVIGGSWADSTAAVVPSRYEAGFAARLGSR